MGLLITIVFIILSILLVCASYTAIIYKSLLKHDKDFLENMSSCFDEDNIQTLIKLKHKLKNDGEHNRKMLDEEIKSLSEDNIDE
jgi:hypothetical protein